MRGKSVTEILSKSVPVMRWQVCGVGTWVRPEAAISQVWLMSLLCSVSAHHSRCICTLDGEDAFISFHAMLLFEPKKRNKNIVSLKKKFQFRWNIENIITWSALRFHSIWYWRTVSLSSSSYVFFLCFHIIDLSFTHIFLYLHDQAAFHVSMWLDKQTDELKLNWNQRCLNKNCIEPYLPSWVDIIKCRFCQAKPSLSVHWVLSLLCLCSSWRNCNVCRQNT